MQIGYNTNGLTGVDAVAAIELLHSIGYAGVALTLDHALLNPFADDLDSQVDAAAERVSTAADTTDSVQQPNVIARMRLKHVVVAKHRTTTKHLTMARAVIVGETEHLQAHRYRCIGDNGSMAACPNDDDRQDHGSIASSTT